MSPGGWSWLWVALAFACTTWQERGEEGRRPGWLDEVAQGCAVGQLCAIGQGDSHGRAAARAREELAKIFGTKITTSLQVSEISSGSGGQWVASELREVTDEILRGVAVTKAHRDSSGWYALAALDKSRAARGLRRAMEEKDRELALGLKSKRSSALSRLRTLYRQRAALGERYEFLRGTPFARTVSWADIVRRQGQRSGMVVAVSVEGMKEGGERVREMVAAALVEVGLRVVSSGSRLTHRIRAKYQYRRQLLKVEGFEQYLFTFELTAVNWRGEGVGTLFFSTHASGRDFFQAHDRAVGLMRDYVVEHVDQLNISGGGDQ